MEFLWNFYLPFSAYTRHETMPKVAATIRLSSGQTSQSTGCNLKKTDRGFLEPYINEGIS
ncbi:hypothetical protein [Treponema sp.]|uniref:hypothetical protein n=1 Tax=Treponema sp. TaxID=166 RepID=UPI003EFFD1ED